MKNLIISFAIKYNCAIEKKMDDLLNTYINNYVRIL